MKKYLPLTSFLLCLAAALTIFFTGCGQSEIDIRPKDDYIDYTSSENKPKPDAASEISESVSAAVTTTLPEISTAATPEITTAAPEITATIPEITATIPEITTTIPEITAAAPEITSTAATRATAATTTSATSASAASAITVSETAAQPPVFEGVFLDDCAYRVFELVNNEREKEGLKPLVWDDAFAATAKTRVAELKDLWDHTRPDGRKWDTAINEAGIKWKYIGENLAMGQTSPAAVVKAWMDSPGHRANIMSEKYDFDCIGITCYKYDGIYYWTQHFGTYADW